MLETGLQTKGFEFIMNQNEIFYNKEGNGWFNRNMTGPFRYGNEYKNMMGTLKILELYKLNPKNILDIGSSNGLWLSYVHEKYKSNCHAVDPSEEAIKDGMKKYPFIKFNRSAADQIPYRDNYFDIVHVNFVFCWISRETLLKSVSEIDRVLENKGFLILRDFCPQTPEKVPYHHHTKDEVWTFKQDNSKLFTSLGRYDLLATLTGSELDEICVETDKNKRTAISLMQKNSDLYTTVELKR